MNSPDDNDPKPESELAYAPPWIREQAAREQGAREQGARDQAARDQAARDDPVTREQATREPATPDQAARDQFRATLRQSGGTGAKQLADSEPEIRTFSDDRPWRQRALEPELVPEPPAGVSSLWPLMLRMGFVCTIAAMVAAAVVFLFSPKPVHKVAQASASAPVSASEEAASPSLETARDGVPASIPALAVEPSAAAPTPPRIAQPQIAAAPPPQLADAAAVTPNPATAAPAQQIASLPPPNSSPEIRSSPAMTEPAPRPADANPAATEPKPAAIPAPAQTAPVQAVPQSAPKAVVVLDENEINTLIRRGKSLLNDGDFSGARVLFERAANAGSAEAALALGSTYDPNVISRLGALMVKPDIESARKWYQLAAERGSAAASLQLANLPQRR
jgi:hypothetical protein